MIYIVTPCSRPENLSVIRNSISISFPVEHRKDYVWIIIFDKAVQDSDKILYELINHSTIPISAQSFNSPIKKSFVGHSHRNYFLDHCLKKSELFRFDNSNNNWVYFLDDDTILHPNFCDIVIQELKPERTAVIFDQINKDGSHRLFANPGNIKVCHIDMGQYIINTSKLPSQHRFKEDDYCADGIFIEEFYNMTSDKNSFHIINKPGSIYNALR